jgi:purine-binding chemotaxis protein CheW
MQAKTINSYLTFDLGDELFAANVGKVIEILEIPKITKVPRSPDYMRGVMNLRGSVLPVIDTRAKFGLPQISDTVETCVIVMSISMDGQEITIGAVADAVKEVMDIEESDIQQVPNLGARYRTEQFIMVLNIDKVFSSNEVQLLQHLNEETTIN